MHQIFQCIFYAIRMLGCGTDSVSGFCSLSVPSDNPFIHYKNIQRRIIFLCTDGSYQSGHTSADNEDI